MGDAQTQGPDNKKIMYTCALFQSPCQGRLSGDSYTKGSVRMDLQQSKSSAEKRYMSRVEGGWRAER